MNMITEKCTGCRACEQLCPKKCISLQADDEGFLQTVIEEKQQLLDAWLAENN